MSRSVTDLRPPTLRRRRPTRLIYRCGCCHYEDRGAMSAVTSARVRAECLARDCPDCRARAAAAEVAALPLVERRAMASRDVKLLFPED